MPGEAQMPVDDGPGDLVECHVLGECVRPQDGERVVGRDGELGHHHAGRLVDLCPIAPGPVPGLLVAGTAEQPQQD
jgi:hypothetical protein